LAALLRFIRVFHVDADDIPDARGRPKVVAVRVDSGRMSKWQFNTESPLKMMPFWIVPLTLIALSTFTFADEHVEECGARGGVEKLRCERHLKMAGKCGPLAGDAHFACDREFLMAHPLVCTGLKDADQVACAAEGNAFKACQSSMGREFMRCVTQTTGQSPMGH
jgi:hypothetical protein